MAVIRRAGQAFAAIVGAHCIDMKDRTKRVWQESVIELCHIMNTPIMRGGNMPVRYGFLRSSLMASVSPLPFGTESRPVDEPIYMWFPNRLEAVVMSAKVGQKLFIGYMADYAYVQEFRYGFVRLAAQRWPEIVARTEQRIMAS